jgi:hypothetical protein
MIIRCECEHEYQDKKHGLSKRVHNPTIKYPSTGGWRCTVCSKVKGPQPGEKK